MGRSCRNWGSARQIVSTRYGGVLPRRRTYYTLSMEVENMAKNRKLGRPSDHRMAMLRAMVTFLLENGRIETTVARAKEVAPLTEKMITLGKKNTLASRRQAMAFVTKESVVANLFSEIAHRTAAYIEAEIAPQYSERNGGYTRIIKTGPRRGDCAEMAIIELV